MPIRKRGDTPEDPDKVRLELPRRNRIPDVPASKSLVEMQNFKGFQYMKPPPGEDLLLARRRKKRFIEMARSLPFVSPTIGQILHGAAAFFVQHEVWQRIAFESDPTTKVGMRAAAEAAKYFGLYQRAWVTALDTSIRFARGMSGLKALANDALPPWVVKTEGEEVEEKEEADEEDETSTE